MASKSNYSTTMAPIDDAIDDLRSQKTPRIVQTAKKYNVHHSTLSRRFHGVTVPRAVLAESQSLLTNQQQLRLIKLINDFTNEGIPPTNAMVRNFAEEIVKKRPGKNWVTRFYKAHEHTLQSRYLAPADLSRKKADNYYDYKFYFELVCGLILLIICANSL
jgi:hypothetical protein